MSLLLFIGHQASILKLQVFRLQISKQDSYKIVMESLQLSKMYLLFLVQELQYGDLTYAIFRAEQANVWENINLYSLTGSKSYSFKYYCQNLNGLTSGAKILTFETKRSTYYFIKFTIGLSSPMNYRTSNNYACAIAESLVVPYTSVFNSVNGNCKSFDLVFYLSDLEIIWDT